MVKAVRISEALEGVAMLRGRRPDTPAAELADTFATLAETANGGVFAGSFQGKSAWERHPNGDELVQVVDGFARLTVLAETGSQVLEMGAGTVTVVPRGCWHRFEAPDGVTVLTMTPQPTDHSAADDPTRDG